MDHRSLRLLLPLLLLLLVACGRPAPTLPPLQRATADGMAREAFLLRYKDPRQGVECGLQALAYIADTLPTYHDGRLRTYNCIAFDYYMLSLHDSASFYLQKVLDDTSQAPNTYIEQTIALLLQARLEQRACRIANAYRILYDIEQHRLPRAGQRHLLDDYAQVEYYITSLTLNYYYRNSPLQTQRYLLEEIESYRRQLQSDFDQELALNYALAYSYARLSHEADQAQLLHRALNYCRENLLLLSAPSRYSDFWMANTLQLLAYMATDPHIDAESWAANAEVLADGQRLLSEHFGFEPSEENYIMSLFETSMQLFWNTDDVFQHLGSTVSTARHALRIGDTATAHRYQALALSDSVNWKHIAPRFELQLYRSLLDSRFPADREQTALWAEQMMSLSDTISHNEKEDFRLQRDLAEAVRQSRVTSVVAVALFLLLLLVAVQLVVLWRQSRALRREKEELQQAKQTDIERIANVETCLSVLRHDISPFVAYLHNKNIPDSLRSEVVEQLVRTFDNIKNWTNLSIPNGMQFTGSCFCLQEVFDIVEASTTSLKRGDVGLHFHPTDLCVEADRQLLIILLRNLVSNALRYTEQGSVDIEAQLSEEEGGHVQVSIADTGCGMDEEMVESLFRTDRKPHHSAEGDAAGTGFGLILCRYIIKKHDDNTRRGCRIWATSSPGVGSTFYFLIAKAKS